MGTNANYKKQFIDTTFFIFTPDSTTNLLKDTRFINNVFIIMYLNSRVAKEPHNLQFTNNYYTTSINSLVTPTNIYATGFIINSDKPLAES